jgi:carbonic anhydrase
MYTQSKESQASLTPAKALELLRKGNERFQANLRANRNLLEQANSTADGQHPFAVILSCIDSRTSAELIFDQGLGDIFSIRIAGNVLNDDILGSMEFGCRVAGAKLVVVVGHTSCGAVKGACDGARMGHLTGLLHKIQPAIDVVGTAKRSDPEFVQRVTQANVDYVLREIRARSDVLEEMVTSGQIGIVGAMYSVQSGQVDFGELVCGPAAK